MTFCSQVKLSPKALSVYARTQSQPDRICTVEVGLANAAFCHSIDAVWLIYAQIPCVGCVIIYSRAW